MREDGSSKIQSIELNMERAFPLVTIASCCKYVGMFSFVMRKFMLAGTLANCSDNVVVFSVLFKMLTELPQQVTTLMCQFHL